MSEPTRLCEILPAVVFELLLRGVDAERLAAGVFDCVALPAPPSDIEPILPCVSRVVVRFDRSLQRADRTDFRLLQSPRCEGSCDRDFRSVDRRIPPVLPPTCGAVFLESCVAPLLLVVRSTPPAPSAQAVVARLVEPELRRALVASAARTPFESLNRVAVPAPFAWHVSRETMIQAATPSVEPNTSSAVEPIASAIAASTRGDRRSPRTTCET
jgi:hypothetical protein